VTPTDAQLILHAYRAWGTACPEHLLGDFAFAIWDERARRLFCARDPFGVKPFFYASMGGVFAFANSLEVVRAVPGVTSRLDDIAIADFLMFDWRQDPASTSFRDIRRLPPAHCMEVSANGIRVRRYWSLPDEVQVTYRRSGDYVGHFREMLGRAVRDRLTQDRAAITMSGGLDSPTVAAAARSQSRAVDLRAFTVVYDRLIPDQERHYAGLVAAHLDIPMECIEGDAFGLYGEIAGLDDFFPEPGNEPCASLLVTLARRAASHARVVLTGWDGDALLSESPRPYLRHLLSRRQFARASAVAAGYAISQRTPVPPSWLRRRPRPAADPAFPAWIDAGLARDLGLHERWAEVHATPKLRHPLRPYAWHVLGYIAQRSDFFDEYAPQCTGAMAEFRHPFLDLRVVDLCLSLPPYPWCHRKEMLRQAGVGILPEEVRLRPKTPLAGLPYMEWLRRPQTQWLEGFVASPALERYVDVATLASARATRDPDLAWMLLRPIALDRWLRSPRPQILHRKEHRNEYA
jgi:asparagine synthase (glutamine-hydrolysing)